MPAGRHHSLRLVALVIVSLLLTTERSAAGEWFVAADSAGRGTASAPFGRIQDAINAAGPGDVISVGPGTYNESLHTIRGGTAAAPIVLRAPQGRGSVVVTARGRVLDVIHPFIVID